MYTKITFINKFTTAIKYESYRTKRRQLHCYDISSIDRPLSGMIILLDSLTRATQRERGRGKKGEKPYRILWKGKFIYRHL